MYKPIAINRFEQAFFSVIGGGDVFPLGVGSKDAANSTSGKVHSLQAAINKITGSSLVVDGKFGSKTLTAIHKVKPGINEIDRATYDYILLKANPSAPVSEDEGAASTATLSESQLKKMWKDSGSKDTYAVWLRKQKLKSAGSGLWTAGLDWLRQHQQGGATTGDGNIPVDNSPVEPSNKIAGIPKPVFYIGVVVLSGLAVWGITAGISHAKKVKVIAPVG